MHVIGEIFDALIIRPKKWFKVVLNFFLSNSFPTQKIHAHKINLGSPSALDIQTLEIAGSCIMLLWMLSL